MLQAIHIFKKDARYLRLEICLVLLLAGALPYLWPVAAAFLIARAIHAEAIPGDNQFWITRPYRRTSLFAAKLLFIAAFINLPIFLVQLYYLIHGGFTLDANWPGLLWSQILLILCLSLPAAALAAITPGMIAFGFLELIVAAVVFGLGQATEMPTRSGQWYRAPWPSGVEWISHSTLILLATVAAVSILALQFYRRRTLTSRVIASGAMIAGILLFLFLPPQFALSAEEHLTKAQVRQGSVALARRPDLMKVTQTTYQVQMAVPLVISDVPPELDIKVDGMTGTLHSVDGSISKIYTNGADVLVDDSGKSVAKLVFYLDPAFFKAHRDEPLTLHGFLYYSLFGDAHSQSIPQQTGLLPVLNRFRCYTAELEKLVEFRCSTAFRWPGEMVYAQISEKDPLPFYQGISYSPFPAELSLVPFEFHSALSTEGLAPSSPLGPHEPPALTIITKRPLAHVRSGLGIANIWLGQLIYVNGWQAPPQPKSRQTK